MKTIVASKLENHFGGNLHSLYTMRAVHSANDPKDIIKWKSVQGMNNFSIGVQHSDSDETHRQNINIIPVYGYTIGYQSGVAVDDGFLWILSSDENNNVEISNFWMGDKVRLWYSLPRSIDSSPDTFETGDVGLQWIEGWNQSNATDPVNYYYYRKDWKLQKVPNEDNTFHIVCVQKPSYRLRLSPFYKNLMYQLHVGNDKASFSVNPYIDKFRFDPVMIVKGHNLHPAYDNMTALAPQYNENNLCAAVASSIGACAIVAKGAGACGGVAGGIGSCGAVSSGTGACGGVTNATGTCGVVTSGTGACGAVAKAAGGCIIVAAGAGACAAVVSVTAGCGAVAGGAGACAAVFTGVGLCGAVAKATGACGVVTAGVAACYEAAAGVGTCAVNERTVEGIGACAAQLGFCGVVACVALPIGGNW